MVVVVVIDVGHMTGARVAFSVDRVSHTRAGGVGGRHGQEIQCLELSRDEWIVVYRTSSATVIDVARHPAIVRAGGDEIHAKIGDLGNAVAGAIATLLEPLQTAAGARAETGLGARRNGRTAQLRAHCRLQLSASGVGKTALDDCAAATTGVTLINLCSSLLSASAGGDVVQALRNSSRQLIGRNTTRYTLIRTASIIIACVDLYPTPQSTSCSRNRDTLPRRQTTLDLAFIARWCNSTEALARRDNRTSVTATASRRAVSAIGDRAASTRCTDVDGDCFVTTRPIRARWDTAIYSSTTCTAINAGGEWTSSCTGALNGGNRGLA